MIKLPVTERNRQTEQSSGQFNGLSAGGQLAGGLRLRRWEQQAADVTDQLQLARPARSRLLAASARFKEALQKCERLSQSHASLGREPERRRAAVCCKLFFEMAQIAGPLAPMLKALFNEMVPLVYSTCAAGATTCSYMDEVPYFEVAAKLEVHNGMLQREAAAFREQLKQQEALVAQVQAQLKVLEAAVREGAAETHRVAEQAASASRGQETALAFADAARVELEAAKKMLADVQAQAQLADQAAAAEHAAQHEALGNVQRELQDLREHVRTGMVSADEHACTLQQLSTLHTQVDAQEQLIAAQRQELEARACWTPRPEWSALLACEGPETGRPGPTSAPPVAAPHQQSPLTGSASPGSAQPLPQPALSSAATAHHLCCRLQQLQAEQAQTLHLHHLLDPEPDPAPWCVRSEGGAEGGGALCDTGPTSARGAEVALLGLGEQRRVPRMLRLHGQIDVPTWSCARAEQEMAAFLSAPSPGHGHLHAALFHYWRDKLEDVQAVHVHAYALLFALQEHSAHSCLLRGVHAVLVGDAHERSLWRMAQLACGLQQVLAAAGKLQGLSGYEHGLAVRELLGMLRALVPGASDAVHTVWQAGVTAALAPAQPDHDNLKHPDAIVAWDVWDSGDFTQAVTTVLLNTHAMMSEELAGRLCARMGQLDASQVTAASLVEEVRATAGLCVRTDSILFAAWLPCKLKALESNEKSISPIELARAARMDSVLWCEGDMDVAAALDHVSSLQAGTQPAPASLILPSVV